MKILNVDGKLKPTDELILKWGDERHNLGSLKEHGITKEEFVSHITSEVTDEGLIIKFIFSHYA